jgi:hypothetical protein
MESDDVNKLGSTVGIPNTIPAKRSKQDKIIFQHDGVPVQRDLVLNALRAEERPIVTMIKYIL